MKPRARIFFRICWVVFLTLIVSRSSTIHAQPDPAARVIEGAKKEGALVWYTALNLNDSEMLTNRFEQLYPFIKTETLRLSSFSLLSKIQTEARAGAFKADVIEIPQLLAQVLQNDALFPKYISPQSTF